MTQATTGRYIYRSSDNQYVKLDMPYHGPYQEKNINTVIQAIQWMNETSVLSISETKIKLEMCIRDREYRCSKKFMCPYRYSPGQNDRKRAATNWKTPEAVSYTHLVDMVQ